MVCKGYQRPSRVSWARQCLHSTSQGKWDVPHFTAKAHVADYVTGKHTGMISIFPSVAAFYTNFLEYARPKCAALPCAGHPFALPQGESLLLSSSVPCCTRVLHQSNWLDNEQQAQVC